jgi:hypothetical protein
MTEVEKSHNNEKQMLPLALIVHVESVLPRTLEIRVNKTERNGVVLETFGVYGSTPGHERNVWVAAFFDHDEAQSWILASNHFGQPIRGMVTTWETPKLENVDGTRVEGGEPAAIIDQG